LSVEEEGKKQGPDEETFGFWWSWSKGAPTVEIHLKKTGGRKSIWKQKKQVGEENNPGQGGI